MADAALVEKEDRSSPSSHVEHVQIVSNPGVLKPANVPTVQHYNKLQKLSWRQNPTWHTQAPRSFSRHLADQLLHDTRLPSSTRHLYLPCALCTSLQAILLAFSQWWIRRSDIILDAGAGSGTTCNQPARDMLSLLGTATPKTTVRALKNYLQMKHS